MDFKMGPWSTLNYFLYSYLIWWRKTMKISRQNKNVTEKK